MNKKKNENVIKKNIGRRNELRLKVFPFLYLLGGGTAEECYNTKEKRSRYPFLKTS